MELLSSNKGIKIQGRNSKLDKLIESGKITNEQIGVARSLTFSHQEIIDYCDEIRELVKLSIINNISKIPLRGIVISNNKDFEGILNDININS